MQVCTGKMFNYQFSGAGYRLSSIVLFPGVDALTMTASQFQCDIHPPACKIHENLAIISCQLV